MSMCTFMDKFTYRPLSLHVLLPDQALQKAGLCGAHSCTRLLVLHPRTLSDVMDAILEVSNMLTVHAIVLASLDIDVPSVADMPGSGHCSL